MTVGDVIVGIILIAGIYANVVLLLANRSNRFHNWYYQEEDVG